MDASQVISLLIQASYFVAAVLLILGIKRMSSPVTARSGIQWAGVGVLVAVVVTFFHHGGPDRILIENAALIFVAIALSTAMAWYSGKRVAMTDMPQMVALYNGMGGGSAAAIGAVELLRLAGERGTSASVADTFFTVAAPAQHAASAGNAHVVLAVVGALIGSISLTGSVIAWAKLDGRMDKRYTFPGQQWFNALVFLAAVAFGIAAIATLSPAL